MTKTSWVELCVSDFEQSITWFELCWPLGVPVLKKTVNDGSTRSFSSPTTQQTGGEKVSRMTVCFWFWNRYPK
jgi:hypothetical protein